MPNWYQKAKYTGTMSADIVVPSQDDKEQERDTAQHVLEQWLPESPDASPRTAIDSTVNVRAVGVERG